MSAFLLALVASAGHAQSLPRRVLLLYSYDRDFSPHSPFARLFRQELSRSYSEPLEFIEVSLQAARVTRAAPDDAMASRVQAMLAGRVPDLVVPIGGPAAAFAQRNRGQLFPSMPMLMAGVDRRFLERYAAGAHDTAVAGDHEPARLVENILTVLPDTRTVFVVIGASHLEQVWLDELKRAYQRFEDRVTFVWANELSFQEMLARSASLPPHSAILYALLSLDAKGVPQVEDRALSELHAVAKAPIFGLRSTQLGHGIVGGPLVSVEEMSRTTTAVAIRLLNGEAASGIRTPTQLLAAPVFDARELGRWKIAEARLPVGSTVQFRPPTAWDQYRTPIAAALTVAGVEMMLVVALVASLARRRRGERRLRESEGRFRMLSNAAPVMLWVAGRDKVRTDFNSPWLEFSGRPIEAELGNGWLDAVHADDRVHWLETYNDAFDRRQPFRAEYRRRRRDGDYRWLLDTGAPRFLADGAFAGYVGSAIDVTDLKMAKVALSSLSQRLMQAHEQERARVASELQDDLCQRMTVLTMRLHGLSQAPAGASDEDLRHHIDELGGQLAGLAGEIFAISDYLSCSHLDLLGLGAATRIFCKELSAASAVMIDVDEAGLPAYLSKDVALALFRVMQEAVRNAVEHSTASLVSVSLRASRDAIELEVADAGVGFDPEAAMRNQGVGLIAIKERLSLVGGECAIESRPGAGTRVRARVPRPSPPSPDSIVA